MKEWKLIERPGYFGKRRDEKVANYNAKYGRGDWKLVWQGPWNDKSDSLLNFNFIEACTLFYERSYFEYLKDKPKEIDYICSFGECIDNAVSNIGSGTDYSAQESWATHIQDIAVRNVLRLLGRRFTGSKNNLLIIRSTDSNGFRFGPGNVPFYRASLIEQPSIKPYWANTGSVEDFWQSSKWISAFVDVEEKES